MRRKKIQGILFTILLSICLANLAYAGEWVQENTDWYYEEAGTRKTGWINDGFGKYHLDDSGKLHAGWYLERGIWYFLNTAHDGTYGKTLVNQ